MTLLCIMEQSSKGLLHEKGYEVSTLLGKGSFGFVYLATKLDGGEEVAVKQTKANPDGKEGINFTTIREIRLLQDMEHENVGKVCLTP